MPSGFVEHAAFVSGWPAVVIDQLLSRYAPKHLVLMTPEQRADVDAAHCSRPPCARYQTPDLMELLASWRWRDAPGDGAVHGVCAVHGGSSARVKARREQRILLAEAGAKTLPAVIEPLEEPTADQLLISLLSDVKSTLQQIKLSIADSPSPTLLVLLGDWLDRADRISRSVIMTGAEERAEQRKVAISEELARQIATMMFVAVTSFDLTARQQVNVVQAVLDAIEGRADLPILEPGALAQWLAKTRAEAEAAEQDDRGLDPELASLTPQGPTTPHARPRGGRER
jgi:hypothetical protein